MFKRFMLCLALAFAPMVTLSSVVLPTSARAASCFDTAPITGEIRYDPGNATCPRAVVNADGSLKVNGGSTTNPNANPATITAGQQTCTTGAVALPSQVLVNGVVVQAATTNAGNVYTGPAGVSTSTGYVLTPGQPISYGVTNQAAVYIICTNATDTVSFTGN